jgi:hypothetical protein
VDHRTVSFIGGSVFVERNNVFVTLQLGQESCMRFVSATGVCTVSYDFFSPV